MRGLERRRQVGLGLASVGHAPPNPTNPIPCYGPLPFPNGARRDPDRWPLCVVALVAAV